MIESVNVSLSDYCGASCLFCYTHRGKNHKYGTMLFETAQAMINDLSSDSFKRKHKLKRIILGENGCLFLNPRVIDIMRLIRNKLPYVTIEITTNFQNFSEDRIDAVLKENLIDSCVCNIDSINPENYWHMKKLDLNKTMPNLLKFIEIRKKYNRHIPLIINILSLNAYINTIYNNLKIYPGKLENRDLIKVKDDYHETKKEIEKIIDPKMDWIIKTWIYGWAERDNVDTSKINYRSFGCPNFRRIKNEAFIAPDGTFYACCYDANYDLSFGNITQESFDAIYNKPRRIEFINKLRKREFGEIGWPCKTVNCCQLLSRHPAMSWLIRVILRQEWLIDKYCDITSGESKFSFINKMFSALPYMRTTKEE